jgi:hypothetical protein
MRSYDDTEKKAIRWLNDRFQSSQPRAIEIGQLGKHLSFSFSITKKLLRRLEGFGLVREGSHEIKGKQVIDAFEILPTIVETAEHLDDPPNLFAKFHQFKNTHPIGGRIAIGIVILITAATLITQVSGAIKILSELFRWIGELVTTAS